MVWSFRTICMCPAIQHAYVHKYELPYHADGFNFPNVDPSMKRRTYVYYMWSRGRPSKFLPWPGRLTWSMTKPPWQMRILHRFRHTDKKHVVHTTQRKERKKERKEDGRESKKQARISFFSFSLFSSQRRNSPARPRPCSEDHRAQTRSASRSQAKERLFFAGDDKKKSVGDLFPIYSYKPSSIL